MPFQQLGLHPDLLRELRHAGFEKPTPIQAEAIPPVLAGRDLLGCAQTGTGKTAAFALPILQQFTLHKPQGSPHLRALVLSPTRELASQIGESFRVYGKFTNIRQVRRIPDPLRIADSVARREKVPAAVSDRATTHPRGPIAR